METASGIHRGVFGRRYLAACDSPHPVKKALLQGHVTGGPRQNPEQSLTGSTAGVALANFPTPWAYRLRLRPP
jgi:hypothetical protein